LVVFPNSKINLGLNILRKREDGFHDLETGFYPIPLKDALELIIDPAGEELDYTSSGLPVAGEVANNLCVKAWHLLKKDFPQLPAVKMHLLKAVPMGAGLGGGSADGAFVLKLLNEKFRLKLDQSKLLQYAATLGSDGPFFIINKPCIATGRGEILEEISLDLNGFQLVLINPAIHVNTGWAFSQLTPAVPTVSIKDIIRLPVSLWKGQLVNDFEKPVFEHYPAIKKLKEELYQQGALYAAMSGSGSSVFGIFEKDAEPVFKLPAAYFLKTLVV
jgi:4-diphosphocytidyl-2-C-methyl-D-erythritol kinase